MGADSGKKQKVVEKVDGENNVDGKLAMSLQKLQEIQHQLDKINEKASDEVLEIEQKYSHIRQPVYEKRDDIIKAIPDFWLTTFANHPVLGEFLTEEDHKIFKFLSSIEVEDYKDVKSGYTITFNFNPNPYFENTKLLKTYTFFEDGPTKVTASTIKWKEGKGIPNGVSDEKKGNKRPHVEESFFSWFSEVNQDNGGDEVLEIQDDAAEIIKDDLWPNPLPYFNNELDEEDLEADESGDEGKDSEDSDDDNDEQDGDEGNGDED